MQPKLSKIIHRNETRIRVDFPYNAEMVSKLRQITDARWSKTLGAWHVPYTSEAFDKLKSLFPEVSPLNPSPTSSALRAPSPKEKQMRNFERGEINTAVSVVTGRDLSLKKEAPRLIKKPKPTETGHDNSTNIPTGHDLSDDKRTGHDLSTNIRTGHDLSLRWRNEISIEITDKHIFIKLPKNETDIQYIRSFRYARWDAQLFCWYVPNSCQNLNYQN